MLLPLLLQPYHVEAQELFVLEPMPDWQARSQPWQGQGKFLKFTQSVPEFHA